ncbi:MAG TPA: hypothetical protein VF574_15025 [Allosphingosinicella sp.]|jgi:hypothetical protein
MAADDHNPSRRALLGAAVGFPFLGAATAEEAPPPGFTRSPSPAKAGEDWSIALAAFRAAEAEVRAVERATAGSSAEEEEAWLPVYEARLEALGGAVRAVMHAPAPDFAAFADKLDLFLEHELEPHSVDDEVLAAIREDAGRFAAHPHAQSRQASA